MNIKARNWKDLINDQPFTRKDIIIVQDPNNAMKFNLSTFHHIKNNIKLEDEGNILQVHFKIEIFIYCNNTFIYTNMNKYDIDTDNYSRNDKGT